MIRVKKSAVIPQSLLTTTNYNGEDVQRQLLEDQHDKCYICECEVEPNFHIEHLDSRNPNRRDWNNLFLSCGFCNERKSSRFDNILNPATENIEEIIEQRYEGDTARFSSDKASINVEETILLLERLFNGNAKYPKLRNPHEELFFDRVKMILNDFLKKIDAFQKNESKETQKNVQEELSISKALLGFKYWIIKDNPQLYAVFKDDIKWNKQ